jgi:hypothetical protein
MWYQQLQTDRNVPYYKTDIIIFENEINMLIDGEIPGDRNVMNKEVEKVIEYRILTTEI